MKYVFTMHAKERANQRGISLTQIIQTIEFSDGTLKIETKYYAQKSFGKKILEVVYVKEESIIKIITAYWI